MAFLLELTSTILTLVCVILCRMQNKHGWIYGLIGAILLIPLFYMESIWGQCILSFIYVLMSLLGIQEWDKDKEINFNYKYNIYIVLVVLVASLCILGYFGFSLQSIDYAIVVLSLIANTLLIYKAIESWILWVIVNILSIYLFFNSELYLLTIIYAIFLINAIIACVQWYQQIQKVKKS